MYSAGVRAGSLGPTGLQGRRMRAVCTCSMNGAANCNMSVGIMCAGTDRIHSSLPRSLGRPPHGRQEASLKLNLVGTSSPPFCSGWTFGSASSSGVGEAALLSRYVRRPDSTSSCGFPVMNLRITSEAIAPRVGCSRVWVAPYLHTSTRRHLHRGSKQGLEFGLHGSSIQTVWRFCNRPFVIFYGSHILTSLRTCTYSYVAFHKICHSTSSSIVLSDVTEIIRTPTPASPSPMATGTASCHGGNQYRGPGAWKRPRVSGKKSSRLGTTDIITNSPLDLTAILDAEGLRCGSRKKSYRRARKNRSKQSNTAALKARLESLSLLLAPSHGIDGASAPSVVLDEPRHAHHDKRPPVCLAPCCPQQASSGTPSSIVAPPRQHQNLQHKIQDNQAQYHRENPECASVTVASETRWHQTPLDTSILTNPTPTQTETEQKSELFHEWNDTSALRDPSVATKMAVDDRCNAELLDARTALRMLLKEQTKLREAMCRRRLEVRLGTNGVKLRKSVLVSGKSNTRNGRRGRRRHGQHNARVGAGEARRRDYAHPLLSMDEDELQKVELDQMNLADAEAVHLSK